ncbi:MAG: hypothetical protein HC809_14990 [Gammaproteobacteria bacterium]|nr:hypothetical protein [Gammaproteobacteria bacterium]
MDRRYAESAESMIAAFTHNGGYRDFGETLGAAIEAGGLAVQRVDGSWNRLHARARQLLLDGNQLPIGGVSFTYVLAPDGRRLGINCTVLSYMVNKDRAPGELHFVSAPAFEALRPLTDVERAQRLAAAASAHEEELERDPDGAERLRRQYLKQVEAIEHQRELTAQRWWRSRGVVSG